MKMRLRQAQQAGIKNKSASRCGGTKTQRIHRGVSLQPLATLQLCVTRFVFLQRFSFLRTKWAAGLLAASLAVFFGCVQAGQNHNPPRAKQGILNLAQWNFATDGPLALSGEYEFYWQQHLAPESFSQTQRPETSSFMRVPAAWNDHELNGKSLPGTGFATYRLTVLLKDSVSTELALKFFDMGTAYEVFANGKKILSVGQAGPTPETTVPRYLPQIVDLVLNSNRLELIYHVSNFHHHRGGAWELVYLGTDEQLNHLRERRLALDLILFGSILAMGLYHLALFGLRKSDRSALFFGLYCLIVAVRLLTTVERYLLHIFPGMGWELLVKIEYLSYYPGVPVFALLLRSLFPQEIHKTAVRAILAVGFPLSGVVALTPASIFTQTLFAYQIFTLVCLLYGLCMLALGAVRKRKGAAIILIGALVLSATVVNDILDANGVIQSGHFVHLGMFFFIFAHAFMLSARYARAFTTIALQRGELEKSNIQYQSEAEERWQAEEALRHSEERFRQLAENIREVFWLSNLEKTKIIYVSPGYEAIWGRTCESLYASPQNWLEAIHHQDRDRVLQAALTQQVSGQYDESYRIQQPDGAIRWIRDRAFPVRDQRGAIYRIAGIAEDITERRQAEQELRKYYQEVKENAAELKSINIKLLQEIQERERAERELKRSQEELRLLSAHLEYLREEERTRIAREIHDELGQVLSTLKMDLGTLENHLPIESKKLFAITKSMSELIYLTMQRVKRISQELRPSVLDHLTFSQAVAWQSEEFMRTTGISCRLALGNAVELQLAPHAANALYRVLQEALTNIIRHAEATQVVVALEKTAAHVALKIQDNGKGMKQPEMAAPQSFGLIGMRERIHHLHGNIEINSGKNQGTTIICTIPLQTEQVLPTD